MGRLVAWLRSSMCLQALGDFVLGVFVEVAVHVHCHADARMAEVLLDVTRVCVGSDEERCARVAQVMQSPRGFCSVRCEPKSGLLWRSDQTPPEGRRNPSHPSVNGPEE